MSREDPGPGTIKRGAAGGGECGDHELRACGVRSEGRCVRRERSRLSCSCQGPLEHGTASRRCRGRFSLRALPGASLLPGAPLGPLLAAAPLPRDHAELGAGCTAREKLLVGRVALSPMRAGGQELGPGRWAPEAGVAAANPPAHCRG